MGKAVITLWHYCRRSHHSESRQAEYAQALERLHVGLRQISGNRAPHFTDRVAEERNGWLPIRRHAGTLGLERELLSHTLESSLRARLVMRPTVAMRSSTARRATPRQLAPDKERAALHRLGDLLPQAIEFDIVHAPETIREHRRNADQALLRQCHILMLAMIITWRWEAR
ncbi:MAG: hypothetical protein R2932_37235 [Caldilineaceae bacterium]